ncbi:MAG: hypothetical protein NTV05_17925 [Acidobacteria bacterium]|nr:hypothetical protein [Acidobacteriota bacterium]
MSACSALLRTVVTAAALAGGALTCPIHASEGATTLVRFKSDVSASTSLRVSSSVLRIGPQTGSGADAVVIGTIDYRAAARTRSDGEVVLTVEAQADLTALPGPATGESVIEFEGVGFGARDGVLRPDVPEVAGRWVGSGVRTGQLIFTLRGSAAATGMAVPLRFVISLP